MKTALIAAGALIAVSAATSEASAKDNNFSLTIGGPEGFITVGGPGNNRHSRYGADPYGGNYYASQGYGYGKPQYVPQPRAYGYSYGYCLTPKQIRRKLRYEGWRKLRVKRLTSQFAIVKASRYGVRYRLKVDRCNGYIAKAKPVGGHMYGGYW